MVICGIKGCGNKPCSKRNVPLDVSFHRIPKIILNQGDETRILTEERRRLWKAAVYRKDITTEEKWNKTIVCSKHFVDGKPAYVNFRNSPSWLPTLHLGHDRFSTVSSLIVKNNHRHCCVPQCTVQVYKCPTLSFHGFPKDKKMKKLWLVKIRREEGPLFQVNKCKWVCSRHFVPEDYYPLSLKGKLRRLRPDAVPSLFTWNNIQHPKGRKQPAVRLSQANINTNQSENMDAEPATVDAKTGAMETLSKTEEENKKSLKPSSKCKRTDKHLFLGKYKGQGTRKKLLLAPVVQQSESDFPKIPLSIIRLEENPETDASSVPYKQASVSNQHYMFVDMNDLLKPFSIICPAGPSTSCQEPRRNGNNTSVRRQHQTWTTTCDQQSTDFHCTAEVKLEVSSDQEEGTECIEQLETCAVKKEAETELLSPHCCPHQGTVKRKGKSSSEVRLLQPKCEPQSLSTWEYSATDSQDHHINMINLVCIKKEPQDFETLSHTEPVTQIGNYSPGINTRAEILKPQSEEVPFLNMLHADSIKKEPEDFETSWNVERAALTTCRSFESKIETEIYPTGLYHNVHYAQLKSGVHASDNVNEVSCADDASNQCTPCLHAIKAKDDANKLLC